MSTTEQFLSTLRDARVELWPHEGELRVRSRDGVDHRLLREIRTRKAELVAHLAAAPGPRSPRRPASTAPMSFGQESLWFLDRLGSLGSAFNVATVLEVAGPLDDTRFVGALDAVLARHDVFATRFAAGADGRGVQIVEGDRRPAVTFTDLSHLPVERAEREAARIVASHRAQRFDLEAACPFLAELVRVDDRRRILAVTAHHILLDGSSMRVLLDEAIAAYTAGPPHPSCRSTVQYADHAEEERLWVGTAAAERERRFWTDALCGLPGRLDLPADAEPGDGGDDGDAARGGSRSFAVPPDVAARVTAVGAAHGFTDFMVLLAAFEVFLARWSGHAEVGIGVPVDARPDHRFDGVVGYFLNTVVVRSSRSPGETFLHVLAQVRDRLLAAYEHRRLPFDHVVAAVAPQRERLRQPLFPVMFAYLVQRTPDLPGVTFRYCEQPTSDVALDLSLFIADRDGRLEGLLEYASSRFSEATADRFVASYLRLLDEATADPGRPVADLDSLPPGDGARLAALNAAAATPHPSGLVTPSEHLARHARERGDDIAVQLGDDTLTFAALHRRAASVGARLRSLGAGPEDVVALCAERSLDLVAGVFGILAAGAAFLLVDPSHPAERVARSLGRAGVRLCLHQVPPPGVPDGVACLDLTDPGAWPDADPGDPPAVGRDHLAYVVHTSGSTGRPKAVGVPHGALADRTAWVEDLYALTPDDVLVQKAPVSFDVAVGELVTPVVLGARLVLAAPGGHRDPQYLRDLIEATGITVVEFVPSMLGPFLDVLGDGRCPSLRLVIAGGEALHGGLAARFLAERRCRLVNSYGPAETTIDMAAWDCTGDDPANVPIGGPASTTTLHVLDDRLQPVPLGVKGELLVGGTQLARGYLGDPAATASRFLPDPFGPPGSRLYRTGDLARVRPDGAVQFLGRCDHQVKVSGHRIELGEIEEVLSAHPAVSAAVVTVHERLGVPPVLAAYAVGDESLRGDDLVAWASQRLPSYMVPATVTLLDELPLTPNQKVDRSRLPEPAAAVAGRRGGDPVAPRTPEEHRLAAICAELLGVEEVGMTDDFFDLGGHSLLAMQLLGRVTAVFGPELPLREFYAAPTLRTLSVLLSAHGDEPRTAGVL